MSTMQSGASHILISGGVRSGKSRFAEGLALRLGGRVIYLATATAGDAEMAERIARHQARRPQDWMTVEEPLHPEEVIRNYSKGYTILLDCLTLFLSNLYFELQPGAAESELSQLVLERFTELAQAVAVSRANLVLVTNEVGWGIVPDNPLARSFRDLSGLANQEIARVCDQVYLVVTGIPLRIKGTEG
ncbi:MAG TPA: bifunctional adenosylcobinamide kinase/adenosylcobinamide-phosphate guanylyltransferase [Bacillota bacterium]